MTTDTISTQDAPYDAPPPPRRSNGVAILVTVLGVALILGLLVQGLAFGVHTAAGTDSSTQTADVDGVTSLDLDTSSGDLAVTFASVNEATLDITTTGASSDGDWSLEVDGDRLVVRQDNDWFWFWPNFGSSRTTAELVLPDELEGVVSAQLSVSAGSMSLRGDLAEVEIDVAAGSLTFEGASTSLDAEVSAGDADVVTSGPETVDIRVSAGRLTGTITGEAPARTSVEVSAGNANLDLPDAEYAVTGGVSAGDRSIDVRTDPASPHQLHVEVSAGDAVIGYST